VIRHDLPAVVALADLPATATGDAGGKAANLARIAQETDLLVPPGFVVTAGGYDRFLKDNHLDQLVLDELAGLSPNDPQLAEVSERLVSLILGADVPEELLALLQAHYHTIEQQDPSRHPAGHAQQRGAGRFRGLFCRSVPFSAQCGW
jgi:pyruvate,water dikinase